MTQSVGDVYVLDEETGTYTLPARQRADGTPPPSPPLAPNVMLARKLELASRRARRMKKRRPPMMRTMTMKDRPSVKRCRVCPQHATPSRWPCPTLTALRSAPAEWWTASRRTGAGLCGSYEAKGSGKCGAKVRKGWQGKGKRYGMGKGKGKDTTTPPIPCMLFIREAPTPGEEQAAPSTAQRVKQAANPPTAQGRPI